MTPSRVSPAMKAAASLHSLRTEVGDDASRGQLATGWSGDGRSVPRRGRTESGAVHVLQRSITRDARRSLAVVPRGGWSVRRARLRRQMAGPRPVRAPYGAISRIRALSRDSG